MKWYSNLAHLAMGVSVFMLALIFTVGNCVAQPAQVSRAAPAKKLIKPGQLMIGGFVVKCGSTPALISEHYPDFGAAQRGLIILNPVKLRALPRGAKLLIYYHECAHQYVGGSELAADCWAVQKVRREGLMNRAGLKSACTFIKNLPANRRHPSGKMRCQHMKRCYNETFHRKADLPDGATKQNPLSNSGFSRSAAKPDRSFKGLGHRLIDGLGRLQF